MRFSGLDTSRELVSPVYGIFFSYIYLYKILFSERVRMYTPNLFLWEWTVSKTRRLIVNLLWKLDICTRKGLPWGGHWSALHCNALYCFVVSVLQCLAVICNALYIADYLWVWLCDILIKPRFFKVLQEPGHWTLGNSTQKKQGRSCGGQPRVQKGGTIPYGNMYMIFRGHIMWGADMVLRGVLWRGLGSPGYCCKQLYQK